MTQQELARRIATMTQQELAELLRAALAAGGQAAPEEHRDKTPQCPPLLRFRDLVYRPSLMTGPERLHMPRCRYCRMTLQRCKSEAYHPPAPSLAGGPIATEEAAKAVTFHIEQQRCAHCQGLAACFQDRAAVLEERDQWPGVFVWGGPNVDPSFRLDWEVAIAPAFATDQPARFVGQYPSEDGSVTATLRETDAGELRLHVDTQNPALDGSLWRVALLTEVHQEVQSVFVVLYPGFDGQRWGAEIRLGSVAEVARQAPHGFSLWAYPLTAASLTGATRTALLWSLTAIAGNRAAVAGWASLIAQNLGRPLPAAVVELLHELQAHLEQSSRAEGPFAGGMAHGR